MTRAIKLHPSDNVATLIDDGSRGDMAELSGEHTGKIKLGTDIPYGHKCALTDLRNGDDILKYGQIIGRATSEISVGDHVHVHNIEALRARGDR